MSTKIKEWLNVIAEKVPHQLCDDACAMHVTAIELKRLIKMNEILIGACCKMSDHCYYCHGVRKAVEECEKLL